MRFAILIPAHNEGAVIERKIYNTHRLRFPRTTPGAPHVAIVIDDHSSDDCYERAKSIINELSPREDLQWRLIQNHRSAGKGNALRAGFEEAAGMEIFIMTDADAVVSADAPLATAASFADPRVGAATGMQQYVEQIHILQISGDRLDLYDRASEGVRLLESKFGMLFSVHGPWFALRASAGGVPVDGVAADDLDLALQIRERGWKIVAIRDAIFYEVKPTGEDLQKQQIRRARAYFEAMDAHWRRSLQIYPRGLGTLQFFLYAFAPPLLAICYYASFIIIPFFIGSRTGDPALAASALLFWIGILLLRPFHGWERYARVILQSRFSLHRREADRWEPLRGA